MTTSGRVHRSWDRAGTREQFEPARRPRCLPNRCRLFSEPFRTSSRAVSRSGSAGRRTRGRMSF
ncbi:DUF6411 family protein [Streptomyces scabiei]|uniref:DUF6411 family protein n=1 Tax=Streptomyces scabiei TaxID=1930 RepID=UPI003AF0D1BC